MAIIRLGHFSVIMHGHYIAMALVLDYAFPLLCMSLLDKKCIPIITLCNYPMTMHGNYIIMSLRYGNI